MLALLTATSAIAEKVRLAVTSSFHNSGLSDHIIPHIETDLEIDIQLIVVGTGQALKLGENGDVDAILVHSKPDEEEFVKKGFANHRREIMFNEYVIVGPSSDPAQISSAKNLLRPRSGDTTEEQVKRLQEGLIQMCDANIAVRHQLGAITAIVVSGQLLNERTNTQLNKIVRKL